ncbi:MAG: hypothetical protein KAG66_04535, partial [Methylococcales bacterium]|nr:hypothetical protein [Methylococcales bacterium]
MSNKRKVNKTKLNFWHDFLTLFLLFSATLSAFINTPLHKWLGIGISAAILFHIALHWRWLETMSRRFTKKMPHQVRLKLMLNLGLLVVFMLLMFSGMIVSLIYAPNVTAFHNLCFYLFTTLITLHLALSWKWIRRHSWRLVMVPITQFVLAILRPLPFPTLHTTKKIEA